MNRREQIRRVLAAAAVAAAVPAAPALALAEVVVHVLTLGTPQEVTLALTGPGGRTWKARGGSGPVTLTPDGEPGEYELAITVDGERAIRALELAAQGRAVVSYRATAFGTQVYVTYADAPADGGGKPRADGDEDGATPEASATTALSSAEVSSRLVYRLAEADDFVAGLEIGRGSGYGGAPSEAAVYLRGAGRQDPSLSAEAGVGLYVDGVYLPRAQGAVLDFLDLERLEVRRGPQGTSYGGRAPGGAVHLITERPDAKFDVSLDVVAGSDGRLDPTLHADAPRGDSLAVALMLAARQRDGFTESLATGELFDDEDRAAGRLTVRFKPGEHTAVDLAADYVRERQTALNQTLLAVAPTAWLDFYNQPLADAGLPVYDERWITGDLTASYSTAESKSDGDLWSGAVTLRHTKEKLALVSITAWREIAFAGANDDDGSSLGYDARRFELRQEQLSQELRLSGTAPEGGLSWLAGGFLLREEASEESHLFLFGGLYDALEQAGGPIYAPPGLDDAGCASFLAGSCYGGAGNPRNQDFFLGETGYLATDEVENTSFALFGEVTYEMGPRLTGTAGMRYSSDEKRRAYLSDEGSETWDDVSGRLALAWRASDATRLYGSLARGSRSGGWNVIRGRLATYEPEEVLTAEVGFETSLRKDRLRLLGAVFRNDWDDVQVPVAVGLRAPRFVTVQASGAEAVGAELEVVAEPARGLRVTAGASWIDAELTVVAGRASGATDVAPGSVLADGGAFPRTPEWTLHVSPRYSFTSGNSSRFTLGADYSYRDDFFHDALLTPAIAQKGYGLLNARFSYSAPSEFWEVALYGRNLTDERYLEAAYASWQLGSAVGSVGRPPEWGVTFRIVYSGQ